MSTPSTEEKKKKKKKERQESESQAMDDTTASALDETAADEGEEATKQATSQVTSQLSYEDQTRFLSPIAKPLASKKLTKRIYKCVKKASKHKLHIRRGVKEVQKFIRKGEKGVVILAGDTNPVDVFAHLPFVCEKADIPYVYTPSRQDLGTSMGTRRPTCVILVKRRDEYGQLFDDVATEMKHLEIPI